MSIQKNANLLNPVCRILFLPTSMVQMLPGSDPFHKKVVPLNNTPWKEIYFTRGTAELEEKDKDDPAGDRIEQSLKIFFPGEDTSNTLNLEEMKKPSVYLLQHSVGGQFKIMGSPDNGARIEKSLKNASKVTGSDIIITCSSSEPCWWFEISQQGPPISD